MRMNIEHQVCTREQGEKLLALGLPPRIGQYSWVYDRLNSQWAVSSMCVEAHKLIDASREAYPALTASEIGELLPSYITGDQLYTLYVSKNITRNNKAWRAYYYGINKALYNGFYAPYEAWAKGGLLVYVIEKGHTTMNNCIEHFKVA